MFKLSSSLPQSQGLGAKVCFDVKTFTDWFFRLFLGLLTSLCPLGLYGIIADISMLILIVY
jgi:hypothetical protein